MKSRRQKAEGRSGLVRSALFLLRISAFCLLPSAFSCATRPIPGAPPDWTAVPAGVVEAFCAKLRSEGISSEAPIAIVGTTQALVTPAALGALSQAYAQGGSPIPVGLSANSNPLPITITPGSACRWRPIESLDEEHVADEMIVQLSNPIGNPFGHNEAGLFARFTVGGHDAQWYWIPIAQRNGQWLVGAYVVPLALRE